MVSSSVSNDFQSVWLFSGPSPDWMLLVFSGLESLQRVQVINLDWGLKGPACQCCIDSSPDFVCPLILKSVLQ